MKKVSDSVHLRRAGIPTFGVSGTFGELDLGNAHGANERLPVTSFFEGIDFLYELMKTLAASPPATNRRTKLDRGDARSPR